MPSLPLRLRLSAALALSLLSSSALVTLSGEQNSYDPLALKAAYALFGLKGSF